MSLFRRRSATQPPGTAVRDAATLFWTWWESVKADVATSIADGTVTSWAGAISSRVDSIHPDLAWELAQGVSSEHMFVLSAEGRAELRSMAERVVRAAPPPDATWQYASSRQPNADIDNAVLRIGDAAVNLGRARFVTAYDSERAELDVAVFHAAFHDMGNAAMQSVFLILDSALGEDAVERWVGAIDVLIEEPSASISVADLQAEVAKLGETLEPFWVVLGVEGSVLVVLARRPLKRAEFPLFDLRVEVATKLESSASAEVAQAVDDIVVEVLSTDGAHLVSATQDGVRTSYFYCDIEAVDMDALERAVGEAAGDEDVTIRATADPGWEAIRAYR